MPPDVEPVWAPNPASEAVGKYLELGPFKGGQNVGITLPYLQAARLKNPLKIHPLLECMPWMPKRTYYVSGLPPMEANLCRDTSLGMLIEFPVMACVYVDYDELPTEMIKERFQPATSPKVEELHLLHADTGWSIRVANRLGVSLTDVLTGIFDFFASPLYVDELEEMHPRAVRVMEQLYFEKREQGFDDPFQGYRKSDALLNRTYFDGIRYDPETAFRKLNFRATNVMVLSLNNCYTTA